MATVAVSRPLSREQHLAKFRACWAKSADRLIETIDRLETIENTNDLLRLSTA